LTPDRAGDIQHAPVDRVLEQIELVRVVVEDDAFWGRVEPAASGPRKSP
jgi:hypothetical protein